MALSVILIALMLLWWATWGIYASVTYPYFPNFSSVVTLVVACFKAFCGLLAIVGVIIKRGQMMKWMAMLTDIIVGICIISFIFQWVTWGLALGGVTTPGHVPWVPNGDQIATMVLDTICNILVVVGGYFVIGLFNSLAKVLENGGNGWERLNYKELGVDADLEEMDQSRFDDDDKYSYGEDGKDVSSRGDMSQSVLESEMDSQA